MINLPSGEITITMTTDSKEFTYKLEAAQISLETLREDIEMRQKVGIDGTRFRVESKVPTMSLAATILSGELIVTDVKSKVIESHNRLLEVL